MAPCRRAKRRPADPSMWFENVACTVCGYRYEDDEARKWAPCDPCPRCGNEGNRVAWMAIPCNRHNCKRSASRRQSVGAGSPRASQGPAWNGGALMVASSDGKWK